MRSTRLLVVAATLAASGCFAYVPSSPQEIAPGEGVRLRLSAQEAMRYADLRLPNPRILEGTLLERSGSELMVEASIGAGHTARGSQILLQRVTVPITGILDVEARHLDTFRTGLLIGGSAALVTGLVIHSAWGSGSEGEQPPDVSEARRIPLLRFVLPFGGR